MSDEPKLTLDEAKARVAASGGPRVSEESIKAKISEITNLRHKHLDICIITMQNGFFFVGVSARAQREADDPEVGARYAYDNAFKQIWTHEGYLLREQLYAQERLAQQIEDSAG